MFAPSTQAGASATPAAHRSAVAGMAFAAVGAIAFSGKAIIVKLACRYQVDAVTVIMYQMLLAGLLLVAMAWWTKRGRPRLTRGGWLDVALEGATVLGATLVLLPAASYAVYLFYSGDFVRRLGSLRLTGLATSVACLCCIVPFLLVQPLSAARAPPVIWLSVLNAVGCTAAPVLLVMLGVERLGLNLAAQISMSGPLVTIAMSSVLLGEPFTPWIAAGTALVAAGIFLFSRTGR